MSISGLYMLLLAEVLYDLSRYHQMIVSDLLLRMFQKHFKFIMAPFAIWGGGGKGGRMQNRSRRCNEKWAVPCEHQSHF